ncbi:MAG: hypothetical protein JEZ01_03240 [Labilibaculum sp.]|nr:hypothetical protein [Labilibaculum sp.]MBI9056767.1 hypothetical protein [Labilibaculum sp.]
MRQIFILSLLIIIGIQSCNVGTTGFWKDENISQSLKNEINKLDKKVFEAIVSNNHKQIKSLMSDKLLDISGDNIDKLVDQANTIIKNDDYRVLNQFYVKNSTTGIGNTVMTGFSDPEDYIIHYKALNKEMFISLIIPTNGLDEAIITNIYGKYPEGWKLNIIQLGMYKVNGKTAPQLFAKAKKELDNGYLVDAANSISLCTRVIRPANKIWQYQKEEDIKKIQAKIGTEINLNYSFPLTLNGIQTKPKILTIYPLGTSDGYFPMIEYLTDINLKDTIRTKEENQLIHNSIGEVFKGIDMNKKYILYKAFSEMPNGVIPVPTYGFVKEIK